MARVYCVVEMDEDGVFKTLRTFDTVEKAVVVFEQCVSETQLHEESPSNEIWEVLRIAGDDAWTIMLVGMEVE